MANHLKACSCKACRYGMHHTSYGATIVRKAVRNFRHDTKAALRAIKNGKDVEIPMIAYVGYTD